MCICVIILSAVSSIRIKRTFVKTERLRGEAHLLVEEDSVELSRRGEELFSHAEFTGGDLDAGADWSSCAARGGNLFHTTRTKGLVREDHWYTATRKTWMAHNWWFCYSKLLRDKSFKKYIFLIWRTRVLSSLALDCDVDGSLAKPLAVGRIIPCVNSVIKKN